VTIIGMKGDWICGAGDHPWGVRVTGYGAVVTFYGGRFPLSKWMLKRVVRHSQKEQAS